MIFFVDTSVMVPGRLRSLVEKCAVHNHQVVVPALVFAERLFQLRREKKDAFKLAEIRAWFERHPNTLSVQSLDLDAAADLAGALYARFPDDQAWLGAKRLAWQRCLGQRIRESVGEHRPCGGSVDLYVVGVATPERPIVTEDGGPEWEGWPAGTVLSFSDALRRAELA